MPSITTNTKTQGASKDMISALKKTKLEIWRANLEKMANSSKIMFAIDSLIVFFLSLILFHHYHFQSPYLPGTDGYYHIKYSYLLRTEGFMANFKWATLSLWLENFSDKELLYHILLIPFTYFEDLMRGIKYAAVLFASIAMMSFYIIIRLNKIRFAEFWTYILAVSGGYFLYRANVPRPQILSIILVLWSIHFILNKRLKHLAVLCFIYTTTYTAYLLPFIFATIASVSLFLFEKQKDWKTPATAFIATLTGMMIHPYFPDNFTVFYLQNFYVLWAGTYGKVNLHMGGEFKPMNTKKLIEVNLATIIPYFTAFFMSIYRPPKTDAKTRSLFFISLSLLFITCFSKRFAEYSIPVTLLFCAFFFAPYLNQFNPMEYYKKHKVNAIWQGVLLFALLAVLFQRSYQDVAWQFRAKESRYKSAALFLKENAPKGQVIFTCDWDDAPDLFYYNHDNRYLVFLDPNFMYYWNPKIWRKWDRVSHGRFGSQTYEVLRDDFKITYGVCTNNFKRLKAIIKRDPQISIVHSTKKLYIFKLDT